MNSTDESKILPNGDRLICNVAAQWKLGVKRTTLYKLVKNGTLRCVKIGSRALFSEKDLEDYLQRLLKEASVASKKEVL